MNYTQSFGSSRALSYIGGGSSRPRARRHSCPCVNSATAAVPLPTVKEDQQSNFAFDNVKAFTSGEFGLDCNGKLYR